MNLYPYPNNGCVVFLNSISTSGGCVGGMCLHWTWIWMRISCILITKSHLCPMMMTTRMLALDQIMFLFNLTHMYLRQHLYRHLNLYVVVSCESLLSEDCAWVVSFGLIDLLLISNFILFATSSTYKLAPMTCWYTFFKSLPLNPPNWLELV